MYVPITSIHNVHLPIGHIDTLSTPSGMPRNKAEASARAQEKVALQSEVMPNSRFKRMPISKEADAARKREKRGAEARAQEEIALQSEARVSFVVRPSKWITDDRG